MRPHRLPLAMWHMQANTMRGVLLQIRYHSSSQEPFSRLRIVCCRAALLPMPQLLSLLPSLQKPCFR